MIKPHGSEGLCGLMGGTGSKHATKILKPVARRRQQRTRDTGTPETDPTRYRRQHKQAQAHAQAVAGILCSCATQPNLSSCSPPKLLETYEPPCRTEEVFIPWMSSMAKSTFADLAHCSKLGVFEYPKSPRIRTFEKVVRWST